ncbi:hypothetical protein B0H63DRAFT_442850 [Podospora didyma]|uniref:Uncharacterized protein n=1 Tax=Podospora didyma TaxID=330526 RepID=A0AAE0JYU7_9PEZI|nr:hypothetical protein B0H63DRAFT_442850 [Podospora didyma]
MVADTPASFLTLPSELRNGIYELILLHHEPIKCAPGLLRANNFIHGEASPLFYGQNRFSFIRTTPEEIASFLNQIGSRNTGYIRHILIDFPEFLYLDPGDITHEEDSVDILANIWNWCTNLSTLTTSLYSTNAMEARLGNLEHNTVSNEALKLVDNHFRAISSL